MTIRDMTREDWKETARIYSEGIQTGVATFQTEVPSWEEWDAAHIGRCRLVAERPEGSGELTGFAVLSPTSSRCVYAGVAEVSLYVEEAARGRGVGAALLRELIDRSEAAGYWTLQSGIITRNAASLRVHQNCGFRVIGYRERVARSAAGEWLDVTLVERRSGRVGK